MDADLIVPLQDDGEGGARAIPAAFPEFAWLALHHEYASPDTYVHHVTRRDCHAIVLHCEARARSIVGAVETHHHLRENMVGFVPADGSAHTVVVSNDRPTAALVILVQRATLAGIAADEGVVDDLPETFAFHSHNAAATLQRLRHLMQRGDATPPLARPEALHTWHDVARRLVLQVVERVTGRRPAWYADGSPFERRVTASLVAMIDHDLRTPPQIEDLAVVTGLSPSHCARKFHLSTGMSLSRFVNVRRIQRAIECLRDSEVCLASLAIDLGFSSQSHFTRVFSACTGGSPARYRRSFNARK
jgi:AraC-like DNA-binding protein